MGNDRAYVACETYPAYSDHVRDIAFAPINLGGHVHKPLTLCGREAAWDTRIPVTSVACPKCKAAIAAAMNTP
jgi:hypothetical protein